MPLLLTAQIKIFSGEYKPKGLPYIFVPRSVFSETYKIKNGSNVNGNIEDLGLMDSYVLQSGVSIQFDGDVSQLIDKIKIEKTSFMFVRMEMGSYDILSFKEGSWNKIRDYGILPNYHFIRVNLSEVVALASGEITQIFPHRDVKFVVS